MSSSGNHQQQQLQGQPLRLSSLAPPQQHLSSSHTSSSSSSSSAAPPRHPHMQQPHHSSSSSSSLSSSAPPAPPNIRQVHQLSSAASSSHGGRVPPSPIPSPSPSAPGSPMHSSAGGRLFSGLATIDNYEMLNSVGEGTFGVVHKARDKSTGRTVALKQLRLENEKEGFPITAIREIKILKALRGSPYIVELLEIAYCPSLNSVYLVFEFMDADLNRLLPRMTKPLPLEAIKYFIRQVLEGLNAMHRKKILHRDLKSANILLNKEGLVKLADFGLSKQFQEDSKCTKKVVTLWYRPPELLLGASKYNSKIDIWGVGCIMAELFKMEPLFKSQYNDDQAGQIQQLIKIFDLCGSPKETTWPNISSLPEFKNIATTHRKRVLKERFPDMNELAFDILDNMLTLNPENRPDASKLLDFDFFWRPPLPFDAAKMKAELASAFATLHLDEMAKEQKTQSTSRAGSHPPTSVGHHPEHPTVELPHPTLHQPHYQALPRPTHTSHHGRDYNQHRPHHTHHGTGDMKGNRDNNRDFRDNRDRGDSHRDYRDRDRDRDRPPPHVQLSSGAPSNNPLKRPSDSVPPPHAYDKRPKMDSYPPLPPGSSYQRPPYPGQSRPPHHQSQSRPPHHQYQGQSRPPHQGQNQNQSQNQNHGPR